MFDRLKLSLAVGFFMACASMWIAAGGADCAQVKPASPPIAARFSAHSEAGLKMSPVPVNMRDRQPSLVARGSYLVNAIAGCADCHSYPKYLKGGDPFQGKPNAPIAAKLNTRHFLAGGECYGRIITSNITPNADTGEPANLSFHRFEVAMRTGETANSTLLQVMPWPNYHALSRRDMRAIYEYLSAIPHAEPCNTSCPPDYKTSPDCPRPARSAK